MATVKSLERMDWEKESSLMPYNEMPLEKCYIANTKSQGDSVQAMFNPSEVTIEKSVPWNKHQNARGNSPMLEFTHGENRTLSIELFFDEENPGRGGGGVDGEIKKLEKMTLAPAGFLGKFGHPPYVIFIWGESFRFRGVIVSLTTKYTRFMPSGTPIRATASIKIKEVAPVQGEGGPFDSIDAAISYMNKLK